jgi:hypothetical protein
MKLSRIMVRRRGRSQRAEEVANYADLANSEICTCGQPRGQHDIDEHFLQPCVEAGCADFVGTGIFEMNVGPTFQGSLK